MFASSPYEENGTWYLTLDGGGSTSWPSKPTSAQVRQRLQDIIKIKAAEREEGR